MPRLEVPIGRDGPIIDVRIWLGSEPAQTLTAGGREIPPPFSVPGLVDTGAGPALTLGGFGNLG
jgi:hypothetical protein